MRMFLMGVEGGKPADDGIGAQPEWFYKGDGQILVDPGQDFAMPAFAEDGGEEPEVAGIYLIDGLTIGSPKLVELLFSLGKKYKIACQKNIGGGTDAHKIQRMGRGCLCTTVGVPTRYMHSTVQLCHEDDVEATIQLLVRFMEHAHELGGNPI